MIPYTAVCKYKITAPLTITWEYRECGENKSFEERFDNRALMNVKLDAFNNLVAAGHVRNYQK